MDFGGTLSGAGGSVGGRCARGGSGGAEDLSGDEITLQGVSIALPNVVSSPKSSTRSVHVLRNE